MRQEEGGERVLVEPAASGAAAICFDKASLGLQSSGKREDREEGRGGKEQYAGHWQKGGEG